MNKEFNSNIFYKNEIIEFIVNNGWERDKECDKYYRSFYKENNIGIDVNNNDIVLIDDNGDFAHIQLNKHSIYTLLGFLIQHHFISIDYKWIERRILDE